MRNKILNIFLISVAVLGLNTVAMASPIGSLVQQIIAGKPADFICRKASLFDFRFSIRSLNGEACKLPLVAALAETICGGRKNIKGFNGSHCDKNARNVLRGRDPENVLMQELAKLGGTTKGLICSANLPVLGFVCGQINTPEDSYKAYPRK